jgi:hypothetical protein
MLPRSLVWNANGCAIVCNVSNTNVASPAVGMGYKSFVCERNALKESARVDNDAQHKHVLSSHFITL